MHEEEYDTWNIDPQALEQTFAMYSDVKLVVLVHLYGTPAKIEEVQKICIRHGALLVEDAAESLEVQVAGRQTGSFGDYGVVSFNGNKIITGSSGGMLLLDDTYSANKARKWSTQSREAARGMSMRNWDIITGFRMWLLVLCVGSGNILASI